MFFGGGMGRKTSYIVLIGLACIALGGIPLLKLSIAKTLPQLFSRIVIEIALMVGGIILFWQGMQIKNPMTGMIKGTTMLGGLVLAAVGAIPLLIDLKLLNKYLPSIPVLTIPDFALQALLVFFGFYLLYDAYILSRQFF